MITAMQSAKLQTANELIEANRKIGSCTAYICLSQSDVRKLRQAMELVDHVVNKVLPSNVGPKNDGP
jgi:hypothetical protein